MGTMNTEFEFESTVDLDNIDEKAAEELLKRGSKKDDIEVVEVADDKVTEKDRTAKPLPKEVNPEPTEEELAAYSDSVRQRIEKLTHARHDERREKEQAQRERDEAVQFAQRALAQNQAMERQTAEVTQRWASTALEKIDADLAAAKKEYVEAANTYDTEAMAEAQSKMMRLEVQRQKAEEKKAEKPLAQAAAPAVQSQPTARPSPDTKAKEWAARNDAWFQKDKAMTAFVFGVHEDLVSKNVDPRTDSELYYKKLDEEVRARFPEKFEQDPKPTNTPRTSPVAPASRTAATGRRRVTLTTTELSLAKRLGVTPEQFAAEKIKLENRNG
jgi:hypothetical protein